MNETTAPLTIRQLFDADSSTYSYLLADPVTREAVLIDPVREQVGRDARLIEELGLTLTHTFETHVHADHVTGSSALRDRFGSRSVVSATAGPGCADVYVKNGDTIALGRFDIEAHATPGHTIGCVTYVVRDGDRTFAFSGDALFVRGCGRTDFQGGDARTLYRSVHDEIFSLPDDTIVYPGHDYRGHTATTVAEEKRHNPRLSGSEDAFVAIMDRLELANPRRMDVAVPANLACGKAAS